jgi:hypothetical protein
MIKYNASSPRRRTAATRNGTKRRGHTVSLLTTGFLLFSLSEAHLDSTNLRYESITKVQVLLWPSYDFSIDSAALLGPIALCVRGGANESESEGSIASPTLAEESSSSSPQTSVQDNATQQVETLGAESENITGGSIAGTTLGRELESSSSSPQTSAQDNATQQVETLSAGSAASKKFRYSFSLYQTGDGSETDPDGIPTRYLRMQGNERHLAAIALNKTLQWRREHDIDNLLAKPHSKFDLCKAVFPHYFIGRDKGNHILFVQRPALLDLEKAEAIGLSMDDLLMHYVYVNEYLWQILEAEDPFGEMTSVIDMTGIKIAVLRRKTLVAFVKKLVATMDSHYPQRAHKTLVLNAPKWFNVLFKVLSPLMRESTKKKIEIHSRGRKQDAVLKQYLGEKATDVLPADMWSTSATGEDEDTENVAVDSSAEKFLQNELERELRSFVSTVHATV